VVREMREVQAKSKLSNVVRQTYELRLEDAVLIYLGEQRRFIELEARFH